MEYNFHVDSGHGWVEVPYSELAEIGVTDKISHYSYRKGNTCYLEEDCDMSKWALAHTNCYGKEPNIKYVHHDKPNSPLCFIRNLNHYRAS